MPEDRCLCVPLVGVYQHARDDTVAIECLAVCEVRVGLSGVGGGVIPCEHVNETQSGLGTCILTIPLLIMSP